MFGASLTAGAQQGKRLLYAVDDVQVISRPSVMELLLRVREPSGRWRLGSVFNFQEQGLAVVPAQQVERALVIDHFDERTGLAHGLDDALLSCVPACCSSHGKPR